MLTINRFLTIFIFLVLNKASFLIAMNAAENLSAEKYKEQVVWYVHLQKNFVPYSLENSLQIEADYQDYIVNPEKEVSHPIKVQITPKQSGIYIINFSEMLQKDIKNDFRYRAIRRIKYRGELKNLALPLPLSYDEIEEIGGHPVFYLSAEELKNKKINNEDKGYLLLDNIAEDSFVSQWE